MKNRRAPVKVLRTSQRIVLLGLILALILLFWKSINQVVEIPLLPTKPTHIQSIFVKEGELGLNNPQGIAINPRNKWLYVTSSKNSRVFVFDENYNELFSFGQKNLKVPVYIAINNTGYEIYVTDRNQKGVFVFDKDGQFLRKLALKEVHNPLAITLDKYNNIYLTDTGKEHQVLKYNPDGKLLLNFGYKKRAIPVTSSKGGFFYPNGIALDKDQNIYVADSDNERIQIFNKEGYFKKMILTGGLPRGIAINEDSDKKSRLLFISDTLRHRISIYNLKNMRLVRNFSQYGQKEGDVAFPNATILAGDNKEQILVVDRENGRIQLFKTKLSVNDIVKILWPYRGWIRFPFAALLLLLFVSRRRKYIISDCFIDDILKNNMLEELLIASKSYQTSTTVFNKLTGTKLLENFNGQLTHNPRFNHNFAEKMQKQMNLTYNQAETLALAHHRGIYQPVLLAADKNLLKAADNLGIKAVNIEQFFNLGYTRKIKLANKR